MKVYVLEFGEYSSRHIHGVFASIEDAKEAAGESAAPWEEEHPDVGLPAGTLCRDYVWDKADGSYDEAAMVTPFDVIPASVPGSSD